jgi:hypothetical protein
MRHRAGAACTLRARPDANEREAMRIDSMTVETEDCFAGVKLYDCDCDEIGRRWQSLFMGGGITIRFSSPAKVREFAALITEQADEIEARYPIPASSVNQIDPLAGELRVEKVSAHDVEDHVQDGKEIIHEYEESKGRL